MPEGLYHQEGPERGLKYYLAQKYQILSPYQDYLLLLFPPQTSLSKSVHEQI